jgi:sulfoxide reductase catalytic subunit YedY
MLIKKASSIVSSEITPQKVYLGRRKFLAQSSVFGMAAAGAYLIGGCSKSAAESGNKKLDGVKKSPLSVGETPNTFKEASTYNNFYEFGTAKSDPAENAGSLVTRPWTVKIEGEVEKPQLIDIEQILKLAPLEERVYRFRCVEAWSMVVPWVGYSLSELLKRAKPTNNAKFVEFTTLQNPKQMPGQRVPVLDWPYVEGLRMDEAMHPLTLLCVGMYGEILPNQNGAPVRLIVPWKYGFKSIKSIVRIRFVQNQPKTSWEISNSREYGFFSNVNPEVDHPRWSQATERRLGELRRRKTLPFNGYQDQVAGLYAGMDLRKYF